MSDGTVLARPFVRATIDILATMAGMAARAGQPFVKQGHEARGDVSAVVGVTGDKIGTVAVSFSRSCALALVKGMLGEDIQDILEDTQDAVGEIANMISGHARASLSELGVNLQGSTPTVIVGEGHIIRHISSNPVVAIPFSTDAGEFTVEFCF
jgi:chemotaxis protein CheX